jgi:hypothetical protein
LGTLNPFPRKPDGRAENPVAFLFNWKSGLPTQPSSVVYSHIIEAVDGGGARKIIAVEASDLPIKFPYVELSKLYPFFIR